LILPSKKAQIKKIRPRLIDLQEIFTQKWYLNPKLNGSTRIEDVIPDLCQDLNWTDLKSSNIQNLRMDFVYRKNTRKSDKATLKNIYSQLAVGLMNSTGILIRGKTIF